MKKTLILLLFFTSLYRVQGQQISLKIGDTLPNFSYSGQFAKDYFLKDLQGSYVLVNFWASWNEESRNLQMDFIESYNRFRDKKFKKGRKFYIISISLDEGKAIWELTLKKDNLPWKNHACDFRGWDSPIVQNCGLQSIPSNFLLDPNGIIVAKNLTKSELDEILKGL